MTDQAQGTATQSRDGLGLALLAIGLLLLGWALASTVSLVTAKPESCRTPPNAVIFSGREAKDGLKKTSLIAVSTKNFRLGGGLCVGINLERYFAKERAEPNTGGQQRVRTVQIFFDNTPTPATLTLDIDGKGNNTADWTGWHWQRVALRPAALADTEIGKRWRTLLTNASPAPSRPVWIGVGDKLSTADAAVPKDGAVITNPITLEAVDPLLAGLGLAGLVLAAIGSVRLCWSSGLLRSAAPSPTNPMPPFSLGRVQMGFWLLLSIAGFLAIWLITGVLNGIITNGLLALLGISAGSGLAARLIDVGGTDPQSNQSNGFWRDILSENYGDGKTIVIHRLQMVAWTIILGMVFLWSAMSSFSLPDFDANLLLLMGISNSTYVGFKFPEAKNAGTPPDVQAAPAIPATPVVPVAPPAAPPAGTDNPSPMAAG